MHLPQHPQPKREAVENIDRKVENVGNQYLSLFPSHNAFYCSQDKFKFF